MIAPNAIQRIGNVREPDPNEPRRPPSRGERKEPAARDRNRHLDADWRKAHEDFEKDQSKRSTLGKILVIEDRFDEAYSLINLLKDEGYSVCWADRGDDGREIIKSLRLDLIVLDLMLPVISGVRIIEMMRSNAEHPTPILAITGNRSKRLHEYALLLGVDGYLDKPFTLPAFLHEVRRILQSPR
jgi:adenylate cyclase